MIEIKDNGGSASPKRRISGIRLMLLIVAFVIAVVCAAFLTESAVYMQEMYSVYTSDTEALETLNNNVLRKYSIYALSGFQYGFNKEELDDTNFRFAIVRTADIDSIDLSDKANYIAYNVSDEFFKGTLGKGRTPESAYRYSCDLSESSTVRYSLENISVLAPFSDDYVWNPYNYSQTSTYNINRFYYDENTDELFAICDGDDTLYNVTGVIEADDTYYTFTRGGFDDWSEQRHKEESNDGVEDSDEDTPAEADSNVETITGWYELAQTDEAKNIYVTIEDCITVPLSEIEICPKGLGNDAAPEVNACFTDDADYYISSDGGNTITVTKQVTVGDAEGYYVYSYMEDPADLSKGDLFAAASKYADMMHRFRWIVIVFGVVFWAAALCFGIRLFIVFCGVIRKFFGWLKAGFIRMRTAFREQTGLFVRCLIAIVALNITEIILGAILVSVFWEGEALLFVWFIEKLMLTPLAVICVLQLRKIREGAKAVSEGDLSYRIDTTNLLYDFKAVADDLNNIGGGLDNAVSERMKSERFKTELITNVSHDIKTPLTSIINYTDLLRKLPDDAPERQEYLDILEKQSVKLKTLLENLIEASKASSGALKTEMMDLDAKVILTQVAGEYEESLKAQNIDLKTTLPEESVMITADAKHLQRVFDNILTNIRKFAQPGTRAYVSLEKKDGRAEFSFKNTSATELNVSAEELLQRFSRGDASRSTEGHGLGLSIAQSLTELMGGRFEIVIDGDLFKTIVSFPHTGE